MQDTRSASGGSHRVHYLLLSSPGHCLSWPTPSAGRWGCRSTGGAGHRGGRAAWVCGPTTIAQFITIC